MDIIFAIRRATMEARHRTGDNSIGTSADCGEIRVVRVTYGPSGVGVVQPLTGPMNADQVIEFLGTL